MKTIKSILKWFFGILFIIIGLASFINSPLVAVVTVLLGLFLLPPILKIMEKKMNYSFSSPLKWGIAIGGLFLMTFAISMQASADEAKIDKEVEQAREHIQNGEMNSALKIIKEAKSKYTSSTNRAVELETEIENSTSIDFAKEQLVKLSDDEFSTLENGNLSKSILSIEVLNSNLIELMKKYAPERKRIIEEVELKKQKEREAAENKARKLEQENLKKNRKELIDKQFSAWDGSHPALTRMIKESMNDPDSYDHMETKFRDDGNTLFVITKFRGANAFGGKVINSVSAKVDLSGNVLEIVSQN